MDTEKKVQFVALTKEEIDAMIQQAALAGAQVASDAMMVGQRKSEKEKIDRRLHNTDLLLRNYRTLKASYENAVYKSKEGEVTEVLEDIMTMKDDKAAQWFHIVQHRGQARYYKEHQLEILLLGRRKADGNYVGKDNIYTNSAGITRYSPLAEWRHEDILAYIHYYDVKLPPIYDWEKGYLCGTHPWPARQYMETEQQ